MADAAPLSVEYVITSDDLFAFQWRAAYNSALARRARRLSYAGWFLALFLFTLVPTIGRHGLDLSQFSLGFLVVSFAIAVLLQYWLERWLLRRAIRQLLRDEQPDRGHLGTHRIVLDDAGVLERTVVGESRTAWAGVHRVESDADYLYLYTSPAGAHVVPKRAFADPQAADAFHQFSLRHTATSA